MLHNHLFAVDAPDAWPSYASHEEQFEAVIERLKGPGLVLPMTTPPKDVVVLARSKIIYMILPELNNDGSIRITETWLGPLPRWVTIFDYYPEEKTHHDQH